MIDFFLDLFLIDIRFWFLRLALILIIPVILIWVLHIFLVRWEDEHLPIVYSRRLALNKSIIVVTVIINVYWYLFLSHNGLDMFNFFVFPWSLYNVYFALLPLILSYSLMIYWYVSNSNKLINSI